MKANYLLFLLFLVLLLSQGCNTLYNTGIINIEVVEPAKVRLPAHYRTIAVRYNNCNVAPNPYYQNYYFIDKALKDRRNLDSIASIVYFDHFISELHTQNFFDSITVLESKDYNTIKIRDSITHQFTNDFDSLLNNPAFREKTSIYYFSKAIRDNKTQEYTSEQYLHPRLGLYQPEELDEIADSTGADILISLDYFSSLDGITYDERFSSAHELVITQGFWNFYDLNEKRLLFFSDRKDTISWDSFTMYPKEVKKRLPPRRDAVLNAADMSGTNYAGYLVPHWTEVQRMYYSSGHVELKQTDELIQNGKWTEAASIWKTNTKNPNKAIEAKCKFNMALACEMEGNLDAALEWVVESFHVFGKKNEQHYYNCMDYIRIIAQRQRDIKLIETQFGEAD